MLKIICPTDFTPSSTNAIEYAAKLCQQMNASLTLMNIQKVYMGESVNLFSGVERESVAEAKQSALKMDEYCKEINTVFKISCTYEIVPTMGSFEKAASDEANSYDLTVIGTNGSDTLYEYYFGSHSFRMATKLSKPVLVIPQDCSFSPIRKVIFASAYHKGDSLLLQQLQNFLGFFKPNLQVLHVSEKDSPVSKEIFQSFCHLLEDELNYENKIDFQRIIDISESHAFASFMHESDADLLAVCYEEHGFLYRLTHANLVKSLTHSPDFPILICHK